ncbi:hypothetical protein C1645_771423 [Glomus cerebriforme]|uniref:HMG box domain-containing protein n=1 Tax=Glomus cerebriforme TaxID=658196 RepID=A0A397T0N0_9GLOM|nr:hypothetical protein C1645_771423 [Glomus cerebriforme]
MSSQVSRSCVFINSNNPTIHNQVIDGTEPIIKLPFPPQIDPYDLIIKSQGGKIPSRSPNAFIIYRKVYIETARSDGYNLPMTVISSMASKNWERECEDVKEEYRRLAKEAFDARNEMLPKANRKRKRQKWNLVSFGKSNRFHKNSQNSGKEITSSIEVNQPSPISSSETQSVDSNQPTKITNNEISSIIPSFEQFNFDFAQYMIQNSEFPEIYNSSGSSSPEINDYAPPESSSNNLIETPILSEGELELFNLIAPIDNDNRNGPFLINRNEFGNFGESCDVFSNTINILSLYSENNYSTDPSSGLDFDFSYHY